MEITDLPDPDDAAAIFEFAMTFNGYDYFGSFDASANAAALGDRSSLDLIRNELFFVARASRNGDDDRLIILYRELMPLFAERCEAFTRISGPHIPSSADGGSNDRGPVIAIRPIDAEDWIDRWLARIRRP
ncbi:hypothetical protein [Sphingomonas sp. BK481]|uniref:hypothetical protein n=1 Tax=Sphingomonas sp. BK481 TaxID=2586981 RepID=UPI00179D53E8|nr:hypothetical protein [Sphingomonas sp. BK481]MBB3587776.1 hypothetical protein [Sphingomonas sp. BK481]